MGDAGDTQSTPSTSALEEFAELAGSEPVELDRAALAISAHCREEPYEPEATLYELDRLAVLAAGTGGAQVPSPEALADLLFGAEGFGGNRGRFGDPANSYLDMVVSRRMGLPITLALVTIEVARRTGLELHGVGMPGYFLVGTADPDVLIDAFEGRVIDRDGARLIYDRLSSGRPFDEAYLRPTCPASILERMLNNLRVLRMRPLILRRDAASRARRGPSLVAVLQLTTRLPRCPPHEQIRLGQALAAEGRIDEGARVIESAADCYDDRTAEHMRRAAGRLWAKLN